PLKIKNPAIVKGELGDEVALICTIIGYPLPSSIKWSKNGTELSSRENINISQRVISTTEISSRLVIHNLTTNYLGPYTCTASTVFDFQSSDITIPNKGLTQPDLLKVEILNPNSVKLHWNTFPSDGGMINFHRIFINEVGSSQIRSEDVVFWDSMHGFNYHQHTISELTEGKAYSFKLKACNNNPEIGCNSSPPMNVIVGCHYDNISLGNYVDIAWSSPEDPKDEIEKYKVQLIGFATYVNARGLHIVDEDSPIEFDTPESAVKVPVAANTNYTIQICAVTSVGCGNMSEISADSQCSTPPSVPVHMPEFQLQKADNTEECRKFKLVMKRITERYGPIKCYRIILYKMKSNEEIPVAQSIDILSYSEVHKDGSHGAYIAEAFNGEQFLTEVMLGDEIQSHCGFPPVRQRRSIEVVDDEDDLTEIVYDGELAPDTFYSGFVEVKVTGKDNVVLTKRSSLFLPLRTGYLKYHLQATALGVICGLLIVIIILIVALCTLSKRNHLMDYEQDGRSGVRQMLCGFLNRPRTGGLRTPVLPTPDIKPLRPENLPSGFIERHKDSDLLFQREFESLPEQFRDRTSRASDMLENFFKNHDQTRVKLTPIEGSAGSDYVNANFVMGYKDRKKFICAQGPLDKTVNDFWRMIWEQKVEVVPEGNSETRNISQFHYLTWKDFLAPEHPGGILKFIKRINETYTPDKGPILVHCSAGVGRTGTLVVIDSLIQQMKEEGQIEIYNAVVNVRRQRNFLVQSLKQYIFLYRALLEYAQFGDTEIEVKSFKNTLHLMQSNTDKNGKSLLQVEFEKLSELIEDPRTTDVATTEVNAKKNKSCTIVPCKNRVILTPVPSREHSTYINASFIQGYDRTDTFIITQNPLECSVSEFWRMVDEQTIGVIVMLSHESKPQYWPEIESDYDHIQVKVEEVEENQHFTKCKFKVTNTKSSTLQSVTQFRMNGFENDDDAIPSSPDAFIAVVKHIWENKLDSCGPMVVHCSDGGDRSSMFMACSILMSQIKWEQRVDLFQIARNMRSQRPSMLRN
uniref:protein-tyrosine-phosphatase n=1 Tax=Strigamia maritima TaxID=126957 RepID=T1J5Q6_STRMM